MSKARTHNKVRTWVQLYDRLGRQPLSKTKESRIVLKNKDGSFSPLVLKYDENAAAEAHERAMADIEAAKQKAYAETVQNIMTSITPDLIAALEVGGKADMMETLAKHMSPYAMAKGESVVEATQKLVNGLPFDLKEVMSQFGTH